MKKPHSTEGKVDIEEHFRLMVENVRDYAIFMLDPQGYITSWSSGAEQIKGYKEEEILGEHFSRFYPPELIEQGKPQKELEIATIQGRFEDEGWRLRKDGTRFWANVVTTALKDASGQLKGFAKITRDITEKKLSEIQKVNIGLEQHLRILEQAIEASSVGIVITDPRQPDEPIIYVNAGFEHITGYSSGEVLGQNCRFLQGKDRDQPAIAELYQALAEQRNCRVTLRNYRKDGSMFWNELILSPVFDSQGQLTNRIGIQTDVTLRRQSEEEFRLNEALLSGIINSATDAIITLNANRIVIFNKAAEEIFGYQAGEILGEPLDRLLPAQFRQSHPQHIQRFGQKGVTTRAMGNLFPLTALRKNGEEFPIEATISQLNINGQQLFTAIIRDITTRQQAAAALAKSEAQLRQSQKMEAVGRLAGGVAHDFNNLLTAITGYSDLALASLNELDPIRSDLQEIRKAASHAGALTRQLLTFSRQQILQLQVLDLNEVVKEIHRLLVRVIGEDIKLELQLDAISGRVRADPGQLEQVIVNLAVNARDAMSHGGILTIETSKTVLDRAAVQTYQEVSPGDYIVLTVRDNGTGIDEETVKHIFEPFFTTKEVGQGTGLGLSTVYGIVRQCGGFIEVQTKLGKGTAFQIYLPQVEETSEPGSADNRNDAQLANGKETILLVEDAEPVRTLLIKLLSRHGYKVLEARNGGEALLICENYPAKIELMITDMIMPQLNGRQLASRLSKLRPNIKVLFMSGHTDRLILSEEIEGVSFNFLQKPFTTSEMLQKVRQVLDTIPI